MISPGWIMTLVPNGNLYRPAVGERHPTLIDQGGAEAPKTFREQPVQTALMALHKSFWLEQEIGGPAGEAGNARLSVTEDPSLLTLDSSTRTAFIPTLRADSLGDPGFLEEHGLKFPCVAGSMANGIASANLVEAMSKAGMLGFFGAAGLAPSVVETAIDRLARNLEHSPFGSNLIHSPQESALEAAIVDLYLRRQVRLVEASAFLGLTLPIVRYRVKGISRDGSGRVVAPNRIIAKVSRVEVAAKFLAPPPASMLRELIHSGEITPEQADLASQIPMAQDITAEADSGGHTDNRPAITLLPTFIALRDRFQAEHPYPVPVRIGAAGGIATPASVAAAFAMGAAYVMTGSINQACVESGSSDAVRAMLAQAEQADTMMAPAADMFEMGVKLQVLKRGTMFPMRAAKLYELYRTYPGLDDIPAGERSSLEKTIFRAGFDEVWTQTRDFFADRDPGQIERASRDPKHRMALVFRWYLGHSSRWANSGDPSRKLDYQVWCGPSMGAFNEWVKGTFLERPEHRQVVTVALNLLFGAAVLTRAGIARFQGIRLRAGFPEIAPLEPAEVAARLIL